jgi:hypothetical protein
MVLGLVGFDTNLSRAVEQAVTQAGHFCLVFDECEDLEAMIRDEVELQLFDSLIYEGTESPRVVRFSLGRIASLRGELYRELCVVATSHDRQFWEPLEDDIDQWLESIYGWHCEVIHLFGEG